MRLRLGTVTGVAALLAGTACIDPIKPENALYFELSVNQSEFAPGDSLYVTARAVNTVN